MESRPASRQALPESRRPLPERFMEKQRQSPKHQMRTLTSEQGWLKEKLTEIVENISTVIVTFGPGTDPRTFKRALWGMLKASIHDRGANKKFLNALISTIYSQIELMATTHEVLKSQARNTSYACDFILRYWEQYQSWITDTNKKTRNDYRALMFVRHLSTIESLGLENFNCRERTSFERLHINAVDNINLSHGILRNISIIKQGYQDNKIESLAVKIDIGHLAKSRKKKLTDRQVREIARTLDNMAQIDQERYKRLYAQSKKAILSFKPQ